MNKQNPTPLLGWIAESIEYFSEMTGKFIAWLVLGMVILVSFDVSMRYLFQSGSIALQELEWHLFSIIFLLGAGYTYKHDDHVRLDLLYNGQHMNDERRAWINIFGNIFFLIPFCLLIIYTSWPFVYQSFHHLEGSPDPGGLPYRWILKAAIPLGFIFLMLQGIASTLRNILSITDKT